MRRSNLFALGVGALLVIVTPAAWAQGGGGRRGGGRRGGGGEESRPGGATKVLSDDDLDKLDPGRLLLDKAKALELSDTQKHALDSVVTRFVWNSHQFARNVDSLATVARRERSGGRRGADAAQAPDSTAGDEERATHRALLDAIQSIRDEFNAASTRSLDRLTDDQRTQARDIIEGARARLEQILSRV